jgi:hypothetical protein
MKIPGETIAIIKSNVGSSAVDDYVKLIAQILNQLYA